MASQNGTSAPSEAKDAVLVKSEAMPEGSQRVEDFDFNKFTGPITAEDLLAGMTNMGFQASSIGEAVRNINGMVSCLQSHQTTFLFFLFYQSSVIDAAQNSESGATRRLVTRLPSSWDTHQT